MNLLLADLLDKCVLVYMDNILIYSKMADDHVAHVKAVFERLASKNWHVKEKNCALLLPEVEFLGHVVSAESVKVAFDKVDGIILADTNVCAGGVGLSGTGKLLQEIREGLCSDSQADDRPDEKGPGLHVGN